MGHDPTEHVQEEIHHHATHGDGGHGSKWITAAALTAALLAAMAAITALMANSNLTQSTLSRIAALDRWNQFQSKSIKTAVLDTRLMEYDARLEDPAAKVPAAVEKQHKNDLAKKAEYTQTAEADAGKDAKGNPDPKGMAGLSKLATELDELSEAHLVTHEQFERSETLFHISIAIVAIAVVAKRKEFWYVSMVGGVVGLYFFATALAHAPHEGEKHEEAAASGEHAAVVEHKEAGAAPVEHKEAVPAK